MSKTLMTFLRRHRLPIQHHRRRRRHHPDAVHPQLTSTDRQHHQHHLHPTSQSVSIDDTTSPPNTIQVLADIHAEPNLPTSPLNLTSSHTSSKDAIYTNCTAFLTSISEHHIIFLSRRHPILIPNLIQQALKPLTVTATRTQAFKLTFHTQADRDAALAVKNLSEFPVKVTLPQTSSILPKHTTTAITQQHNKVVIPGISTVIDPQEVKSLTKANFVKPISRSMDSDFVSYLLDYDSTPPSFIQIAYIRHTTHPYILPQPMRCDK